jgi:hypothetical protein
MFLNRLWSTALRRYSVQPNEGFLRLKLSVITDTVHAKRYQLLRDNWLRGGFPIEDLSPDDAKHIGTSARHDRTWKLLEFLNGYGKTLEGQADFIQAAPPEHRYPMTHLFEAHYKSFTKIDELIRAWMAGQDVEIDEDIFEMTSHPDTVYQFLGQSILIQGMPKETHTELKALALKRMDDTILQMTICRDIIRKDFETTETVK